MSVRSDYFPIQVVFCPVCPEYILKDRAVFHFWVIQTHSAMTQPAKLLSILSLVFAPFSAILAQDEGFIYGTITTYDNEVYEGPIRWGKEEVYWIDVFNASKEENPNLRYLSDDQKNDLQRSTSPFAIYSNCGDRRVEWFGKNNRSFSWGGYTHQFSCRFGDIKKIRPKRGSDVEIEMQNGLKFDLSGSGYNDVNTKVSVIDKEIGQIDVNWDRIARVEFKKTPSKLANTFGQPVFVTVTTFDGSFTGSLQWDHEERLSTDKIDGDTDDGRVSIELGKIKSIERIQNRSKITTESGRVLELSGTNDVNSENRGIIITQANGTMVDIPWREFRKLTVEKGKSGVLKGYDDFKNQKDIQAKVKSTKSKTSSGKTVIDLDEEYGFEMIQGRDGELEYSIPVASIKKMSPKGSSATEIELKSGEKLNLKDSQDLGKLNQGVLIFTSTDKPEYLPWNEVEEIELN